MNTHPPHTTPTSQPPQQTDDLGPLILTTRAQSWRMVLLALPILLVTAPLFLLFFVPHVSIEIKLFVLTPVLIVWILVTALGLIGLFTHLDFHLHAVNVRRGSSIARTIPYADCSSFKFAVVQSKVNGIPLPPVLLFSLRYRLLRGISFQRFPGRPTTSSSPFPPMSKLDPARDVIAAGMARSMYNRLKNAQPVPWVSGLSFQPDGLLHKPLIGRSRLIPYATVRLIAAGPALIITSDDAPTNRINVPLDRTNAWPGFALLHQLVRKARSSE